MPEELIALIRWHMTKGYGFWTSVRLAVWCLDADQPLYPETTK